MTTQLNGTVAVPPNFVSGTWELAPFQPYPVGTGSSAVTVTEPFRGDITSAGLLVIKGGTTPAQVIVPASGGFDAGLGLLTTNFKTTTATLPGRPITLPLVETSAGVMDVAFLLSVGRAQVLTPQQAADIQALIDRTTAAAARAEAARGDLTGTRAQRRVYDTSVLSKQTTWYETDTLTQMTYWPGIAHTATDLGWRRPDTSNPDAAPVPPPPPDTGVY